MNEDNLIKSISYPRLEEFKKRDNLSNFQGLELYRWNIQLSESLYAALDIFEVAFRNRIHELASDIWGRDWLLNGQVKFNNFHRGKIEKAKLDLKNKGKVVEIPRIIAELNLGFWTGIFDHEYFNTFTSRIINHVFIELDKSEKKRNQKIRVRLRNIRKLRNRIFHYEPIWNLSPSIEIKYKELGQAVGWVSEDMESWLGSFSRFHQVLSEKPKFD